MFANKNIIIYFPSISNHKCTPSERQMHPQGYMYTRLGTPALTRPCFIPISKYSRNWPRSLHLNYIRDGHVDLSIKAKRIDNLLTSSVLLHSILFRTFIVF